jgi:hypothetical protein
MTPKIRTSESHVKLAAPELPADVRSGGEKRPLGYPHLYQIQAGDWRISYAVEHDRLAILVLEVLRQDGSSSKDPVRENLTKKMKVKLLDWPEGSGSAPIPPEELSKKLKVKWLDLSEDNIESAGGRGSRIKLKGTTETATDGRGAGGRHKITLLEGSEAAPTDESDAQDPVSETLDDDRKITPLDEPSM